MGDISDYYRDLDLEAIFDTRAIERQKDKAEERFICQSMTELYKTKELKWIDKEGNETPVQNLSYDHLKNIISFLFAKESKSPTTLCWIHILQQEKSKRDGFDIDNIV